MNEVKERESNRWSEASDLILRFAPLLAIGLSLTALIRTCFHDDEIIKLQRFDSALRYQPRIEIREIKFVPQLHYVGMKLVPGEKRQHQLNVAFDSLKITFQLHNASSVDAFVENYAFADSASTRPLIRDVLLERTLKPLVHRTPIKEMVPSQGTISRTIFAKGTSLPQAGTFHILVRYHNAAHQMYDTYLWANYTFRFPKLETEKVIPLNQLLQFFSNESITIQEMKSTYYVYDKSESEMISKLLE
jgi:hypothetical protein